MRRRICFIYVWATCGGVERVFLNRSEALLRRYADLEIDIFFYDDLGGREYIEGYIERRNLGKRLRIVDDLALDRYDAVFPVDTPRFLSEYPAGDERVFPECHTPYAQHREYLKEWQSRLNRLLVPSDAFRELIEKECPALTGKVQVVRNFLPQDLPETGDCHLPAWAAPVCLYFGRVDELKNFREFVDALAKARELMEPAPVGLIFGPVEATFPFDEVVAKHGMAGSIVPFPPVPFDRSQRFLNLMRSRRAVFVSCSKGESFGLAAAEAMKAGLPVILSDIRPHSALVSNDQQFLYPLGRPQTLATKIQASFKSYDERGSRCSDLAFQFSEQNFLDDWSRVVGLRVPVAATGSPVHRTSKSY